MGVAIAILNCPCCDSHEETIDHLFIQCEKAKFLWSKFCSWWNLNQMQCESLEDLWLWSVNISTNKVRTKGIQLAMASILKGVWEMGNEKVFKNINCDLEVVFKGIQESSNGKKTTAKIKGGPTRGWAKPNSTKTRLRMKNKWPKFVLPFSNSIIKLVQTKTIFGFENARTNLRHLFFLNHMRSCSKSVKGGQNPPRRLIGGDLIFSHFSCSRIPILLPENSIDDFLHSLTDLVSDHLSPPPPPALHRLHSTTTTAAVSPSTGRVGSVCQGCRLPYLRQSKTSQQ
ncbi:hypothetical protein LXL04_002050 [Taraxacum kok-saghyz]